MTKNPLRFTVENHNRPSLLFDYETHPGFAPYANGGYAKAEEQLKLFRKIDDALTELLGDKKVLSKEQVAEIFEARFRPHFEALRALIDDTMSEGDLYRGIALGALDDFAAVLQEEVNFRNQGKRYRASRGKHSDHEQMIADLAEQGFFLKNLDQSGIAQLWKAIEPWRKHLEERRDTLRPKTMASCVVPLPQEGEPWRIFRKLLNDAGIPSAVSDFSRFPMDIDYYALQLSHPYEEWWKGCYEDVGLPTSQTVYLHHDLDYALVKAMVYLQPVGPSNGPFTILPQSHLFTPSYARDAFLKQLDQRTQEIYHQRPEEIDFPYIRKQFKIARYRKEFLKLPAVMRGTSGFGDDILDGSPLSQWILRNEVKVTTDVGNCTVFTGGRTLHRGGMVDQGERWAIQVGFKLRDTTLAGTKTRIKRAIKGALPTQLNQAIRAIKGKK